MRGPLIIILLAAILLLGCSQQEVNYPARNFPEGLLHEESAIAEGKELFARHCASCHGHPGEGRSERADFFQPPAPDFLNASYATMDPAYLYWRIEEGKNAEPFGSRGSVMPAWGMHLDEKTILSLVAYLRHRAGG
ncbi:MAG: hypothetical protein C0616_08365 [Desulfuromonas sp.]|nr:MAG: hypothetical protein C0616_08365 [Desulfuromonas sp.]